MSRPKKIFKTKSQERETEEGSMQRLQRVLASAGFGSRRACEHLITAGRVEVDGQCIVKLGTQVDPSVSKIFVDGERVQPQQPAYFLLNKPVGVVTTNHDPQGRPRVIDMIPAKERVFPVGRLDRSSEGLILLTNDGDLAQQLSHPRYGVQKVYRVTVAGRIDTETIQKMRKGIFIAEGRVQVEGASIRKVKARVTDLEIVLREGKNREIRRILARFGHKVQRLQRIAIGPLRLGDIPVGAHRSLTAAELQKLRNEVSIARKRIYGTSPHKVGGFKRTAKRTGSSNRPLNERKRKQESVRKTSSGKAASPKTKSKRFTQSIKKSNGSHSGHKSSGGKQNRR